ACAVARTLNVPVSQIEQALPGFVGLPHRIQKVGEVEGVVYYDDSKSTTPAATRVAVESIPGRIILLIGGRAKMKDFTELKEVLLAGRVKAVVVFGEHQVLLQRFVPEEMECHLVSNLPQAVNIAHLIASPGEKVLLSPACSSWDQYLNFEERGEHFKRLVYELR
ncbi:MAG: UDP-N-acetylmuramoyl-L-alanine--D-glutamate ligase, partial [Candidatus Atribacteria bacterium]|nr:UDP-N-acetylmuramoyl-L-alanine--D-glutamate ligase [Candidatus Atribacteria bacterium]